MKKILSSSFFVFSLLISVPCVEAVDTEILDNLSTAVENSFTNNYIQSETEAEISLGKSKISTENKFVKNYDRTKQTGSFDFALNTTDLPEELTAGVDYLEENVEVLVSAMATFFWDKKDGDIFYEISDYDVEVNAEDESIKDLVEGFFEITKIFTGETYYVNFKDLSEKYESFDEIYSEIEQGNFQNISDKDLSLIFEILLKSGFFDVSVSTNGNIYTITLKGQVDSIDTDTIVELLNEMEFLPEDVKTEMLNEFEGGVSEAEYKQINQELAKLKKYLDFTLEVETTSDLVRKITVDANLDLEGILAESGEKVEMADLVYAQTTELNYQNVSVTLPSKSKSQINLNKVIGLFLSLEQKWQTQLEDYSTDENYDYSNIIYPEEDLSVDDEEAEVPFDTNAWYAPYVTDLINKGIISYVDNPAMKMSNQEFRELLDTATWSVYNQTGASYNIDMNLWSKLENNRRISKLDALTYIVQTFFPEEKYPVSFAMKKGIVSSSFSTSQARESEVLYVEVIKMLSVTMDLLGSN